MRRLGGLEAGRLVAGAATYDPARYIRKAEGRSGAPCGVVVRAIDDLGAPDGKPQTMTQPQAAEPVSVLASPVFSASVRPLATYGPGAATQPSVAGQVR